MNDTLQTPVATLKAEIVTEFVFTPKYRARRYGGRASDEILAPYREDYEAKVGVKVGNIVKELKFKKHGEYMKAYHDADGNYHSRDDIDWLGLDKNEKPFEELENAGVAVDYMDILVQYQELVKEAKYRMVLHERFQKWERIRALKEEFKSSWIHDVEAELKADRNKRIQAALLKTKIEPKSLRSYLENSVCNVTITYNGVTGWIGKRDGSYVFDGDSVYKLPEDWKKGDSLYDHRIRIADGKTRRAKRLGTLFLKFTEEVDYELNARKARAERLTNEQKEREEKRKRLERITGYPVNIIKKNKGRYDYRGHYIGSRNYYSFVIVTGQPNDNYSDPSTVLVDERINTEYKDGERKEIGREYSVENLDYLPKKKFKAILEILLSGEKVYDKIVYPEKK